MIFAPAVADDLPEIADVINGAYRGRDGQVGWTHEGHLVAGDRTTAETLAADLAATPRAFILTAREMPGRPVLGSVWLDPRDGEAWYLGLLAVDLGGQARGLGRALLAEAEALAAARGARHMCLTVIHVRDDLVAWYERRGYARTGVTEPFPAMFTTLREGIRLAVMEKRLNPQTSAPPFGSSG